MAQTTKNAIRKGFLDLLEQRPLDKISVVDIADHCGVNRNTFYYYYCDIYALVREVLETELDRVLNAPPLCTSWYQLMMRVTAFMRANRRAVYHLYQSSQRDLLEREYYQVVYGAVEDLVRRTAEDLPVAADLLEKFNPADYVARRKLLQQKYGVRATQILNLADEEMEPQADVKRKVMER